MPYFWLFGLFTKILAKMNFLQKIIPLLPANSYFVFCSCYKAFNFHKRTGNIFHYWLGGRGGTGQRNFK